MKGLGTSPGISMGKVYLYKESEIKVIKSNIEDIVFEISRLENAMKSTAKEIDRIYELTLSNIGENEANIFSAHKMILDDPEIYQLVKEKIITEKINCEWAVYEGYGYFISLIEQIEDDYIRARAVDIRDVSNKLLRALMNIESSNISSIYEKSIIVTEDLTPSDTAQINKEMVVGFVTELGSKTSHSAIMARTLDIPAISGVKNITTILKNGDFIIIDGNSGEIIINPSIDLIRIYENRISEIKEYNNKLKIMKSLESISKDGYRVEIAGNIGTPNDIDQVLENGGEGVGLYRTEFLYMDRDRLPTEEEQFESYKSVAVKLGNNPLVIRTLDVGGDKDLPYMNLPKEMNPFLGYRAIRLCLDREDIFKTQLRAILRASSFGNIKIMFPMISNIKEIRDSKAIIEEIKEELRRVNITFDEKIEIGIMVEIPAVAIHSRMFAKEVDFFSIGTNDLIQYTLAVDRGNQDIAHLYNQYHPAVLSLINMTIENGHKEGIWVGMCGEAAGDDKLIPLFLAMGLDEFSMSASNILLTRNIIRNTSKEELRYMVDAILSLSTAEEVEETLKLLSNKLNRDEQN